MEFVNSVRQYAIYILSPLFLSFFGYFLLRRERMHFKNELAFRDLNVGGFSTDAITLAELARDYKDIRIALAIGTREEDRTASHINGALNDEKRLIAAYTLMLLCAALMVWRSYRAGGVWLFGIFAFSALVAALLDVLENRAI